MFFCQSSLAYVSFNSLLRLIFWDWFVLSAPRIYYHIWLEPKRQKTSKKDSRYTGIPDTCFHWDCIQISKKKKTSYKCCCTAMAHFKTNSRLFDKVRLNFPSSFILFFIFLKLISRFTHISNLLVLLPLNQRYNVLLTTGIKVSYSNWLGQNWQSAARMQLHHLSAPTCWTWMHRMTRVCFWMLCSHICMYFGIFLNFSIFAVYYLIFYKHFFFFQFGSSCLCVCAHARVCWCVCLFVCTSFRRCISGPKGLPSETS